LVKELSKIFKEKVEIVAGFHSKAKKVLMEDISEKGFLEMLNNSAKKTVI